jgi:hypothetical protein
MLMAEERRIASRSLLDQQAQAVDKSYAICNQNLNRGFP